MDSLLSAEEVLTIAEADNKRKEKRFRDLLCGLLDISIAMLLFLPFFAERVDGKIQSVSLITLGGVQTYLKITYLTMVALTVLMGILTLALQNCQATVWLKCKTAISLALGVVSVLLFIISLQPYATVFAFVLLAIKAFMLIKSQ